MRDLALLRVLNTRPLAQALLLNEEIKAAKGIPLSCPAIEIKPTSPNWFDLLPTLNTIDQAIFTSANAVIHSISYLQKKNINWPKSIEVTAIGKATASQLELFGIRVHHIPQTFNSEYLLKEDTFSEVSGQKILLFKGEGGRQLIACTLKERGAELIILDVYLRLKPSFTQIDLPQWWQDLAVDIILFTSQQAMENIFEIFGPETRKYILKTPCLVISQRLADIAISFGMQKVIIGSTDSIIQTLDLFKRSLK